MRFRVVRTNGSVYMLLIPGIAPKRLMFPERIPAFRGIFKPFAVHYGVIAER
jgi:hypothetical protein